MRAYLAGGEPERLVPVSVTFVFETQKELDAFGQLMNFGPVTHFLGVLAGIPAPNLHAAFLAAGARISPISGIEAELGKRVWPRA